MLLKMEKDVNACLRRSRSAPLLETLSAKKEFARHAKKKCNNALALAVSCGRLAALTVLGFRFQGLYALPQCGGPRILREVALHGPRFTRRHLADYVHQHLLLYCQDMVVANRSLYCGCRHRPSLRHHVSPDGNCFRGSPSVAGIFRVQVSRAPLCAAGALRARQQYAGNCADGANGHPV